MEKNGGAKTMGKKVETVEPELPVERTNRSSRHGPEPPVGARRDSGNDGGGAKVAWR